MIRFGPWINSDHGGVTFVVLMLCTTMLICTTTMVAVSRIQVEIEANRAAHEVVYDAAKGVALVNINELRKGKTPQTKRMTLGQVDIETLVKGDNPVSVCVVATHSAATDTLSFTYDKVSKRVTHWQDNGIAVFVNSK